MAFFSILSEAPGGLPLSGSFTVPSDFPSSQLLVASGSAWSRAEGVVLVVEIVIANTPVGTMKIYSDRVFTHRAFAPVYLPVALQPGSSQRLELRHLDSNSPILTDSNDRFNVALIG